MFVQWLLTAVLIAAACAFLSWRVWRAVRGGKAGCGGSCACGPAAKTADVLDRPLPPESLRLRNDAR